MDGNDDQTRHDMLHNIVVIDDLVFVRNRWLVIDNTWYILSQEFAIVVFALLSRALRLCTYI